MEQFLTDLTLAMVPVLVTALTGLIGVGITYLSMLVKARFGAMAQERADEYLLILEDAANGAVVMMQQAVVDGLKKDGKWTTETAREIKERAVKAALDSLGDMQCKIQSHLKRDVPAYMEVLVEQALKDLKESGK